MKSHIIPWITVLVAASSLCGCNLFNKYIHFSHHTEQQPSKEGPELVGRVASLPADKSFVLIESYGKWNISSNTILTTRGPENRSANLLVTGEKLGQFAAADLKSGTLAVGDGVYSQHEPKPESPASSTQPVDNKDKTKP